MSSLTRVGRALSGLWQILLAVVLMLGGDDSLQLVALLLALSLVVRGFRHIVYFVSLARHMVGGLTQLFLGVLLVDAGLFAEVVMGRGVLYVCGYLVVCHAISGALSVARALDSRRLQGPWHLALGSGIMDLVVCVICVVFRSTPSTLVFVYGVGLAASGISSIANALRREKVPFIY